jgi:hypothetical protein
MLLPSSGLKGKWRQHGPPKHWYQPTTLHGATTQKTKFYHIFMSLGHSIVIVLKGVTVLYNPFMKNLNRTDVLKCIYLLTLQGINIEFL